MMRFFLIHTAAVAGTLFLLSGCSSLSDKAPEQAAIENYLSKPENIIRLGQSLDAYKKALQERALAKEAEEEEQRIDENLKHPLKVDVAGSPLLGPKNSAVQVILFGDYECPFTAAAFLDLYRLQVEHKNEVALVFKHLPLPNHRQARPAAYAALAANKQGKFWQYSLRIFKDQDLIGFPVFVDFAKREVLEVNRFQQDYINNRAEFDEIIERDLVAARKLQIDSIPVTLVNGVRYDGERGYDHFKKIIELALQKAHK